MEYVYAAMLLHKAGQKIDEASLKKVLEAASVKVDDSRIKALVATLEGVDIEKAIESAAVPVASAPQPVVSEDAGTKEEKKEEKKPEEKKKSDEEAAAGLGSLFG